MKLFFVPVKFFQNPGKNGQNARDNFTSKNAREIFFSARDKNAKILPVKQKNARDNFGKNKKLPVKT